MPRQSKLNPIDITKIEDLRLRKIQVFFKRSMLNSIMLILTMEHAGFRTLKSVKNINRLFSNIDEKQYEKYPELLGYLWCISFFSKQWLAGLVQVGLIVESARQQPEYDKVKEGIITSCLSSKITVTEPEARLIFDMIAEALQFGYLSSVKHEYQQLLEEISFDQPGSFRSLANRLFMIAHSLIDIKHSTNFVTNKVTFNTGDDESLENAVAQTQEALSESGGFFKVGIRRLNSLLSPGYMNGKLYVYLGLPGNYKSAILLKTALDIRKYNPNWKPKTPGMKPCVLYVTMENSFTETIERVWNLCFDDSITDYDLKDAVCKLKDELGINRIVDERGTSHNIPMEDRGLQVLLETKEQVPNIEIVVKYFGYREINTDDLFSVILDLRDDGLEVCALSFDYIKRIRPNVTIVDNVRMELDRIINELKAMGVALDIPIITAHQMNRAAAATVDAAIRQGKGDVTKLVGRENVSESWSIIETADWAAVLNIEQRINASDDRYLVFNVVKRRRVDSTAGELAKYTYLAHPFDRNNGLRLIDDMNLDKVLSLQSLVNDIEGLVPVNERANAVPRSRLERHEFEEN